MADRRHDSAEVNARILYWGCEGSGTSTNLRVAFSKLRPDHRGEIKQAPTRIDPTVGYEVLPIALGEIAGTRTQLELVAVPGEAEQAPTRKQLLDRADGLVFVADSREERADANLASLRELRQALAAYGRRLEDLPLVLQYNHRDRADAFAIEELHRRLGLPDVPVFEAVATQGTGVLQTLSMISKRVIRSLREAGPRPARPEAPPPAPPPAEYPEGALRVEAYGPDAQAAAQDAEALFAARAPGDRDEIERPSGARIGPGFSIVSVGEATRSDEREITLPIVLGDASGETSTLVLRIGLEALVESAFLEEPD